MDREQVRASCQGTPSCTALANAEVNQYEDQFISAFAANPQCHGVELIPGPEELEKTNYRTDWHFDILRLEHTSESETPVFHWTLFKGDGSAKDSKMYEGDYADRTHGPSKAADSICKIITGVGGSLR